MQSPLHPRGLTPPQRRPKPRLSAVGAASTTAYSHYKSTSHKRQKDPTLDFRDESEGSGAAGSMRADKILMPTRKIAPKNRNVTAAYDSRRSYLSHKPESNHNGSHVNVSMKDNRLTGAASSGEEADEEQGDQTERRRQGSAARVRQTLDELLEDPQYSTQDLLAFMDKEDQHNGHSHSPSQHTPAGTLTSLLDKETKSKNNQKKKAASGSSTSVNDKRRPGEHFYKNNFSSFYAAINLLICNY